MQTLREKVQIGALVLALALPAAADIPGVTLTPLIGLVRETPNRIVVGPDGNVWFTDRANKSVGRLTMSSNGVSVSATTYPLVPALPAGLVAVDFVEGITVGPDNAIWFSFRGCPTSTCVSNHQSLLGRVTTAGTLSVIPISPRTDITSEGMVTGPDGNFWLAAGRILRVTPQGSATEFARPPGSGGARIIVGPDQNLWFPGGRGIARITTAGAITDFALPANASVRGLTVGADGNIWFTDSGTNSIGRITTAGLVTEYAIATASAFPEGITSGPDGNIWFTEFFDRRLGRLTPKSDGTVQIDEKPLTSGFRAREVMVIPAPPSAQQLPSFPSFSLLVNTSDISAGGSMTRADVAGSGPPPKSDLVVGLLRDDATDTFISYQVRVTNQGSAPYRGAAQIILQLPPSISGVVERELGVNARYDRALNQVRFTLDSTFVLPPGGQLDFRVTAFIAPNFFGEIVTVAEVIASDDDQTNNRSRPNIFNTLEPEITLRKIHSAELGQGPIRWIIFVENNSTRPYTGRLTITDQLPSALPVSDLHVGFGDVTCSSGGNVVSCQIPNGLGPSHSALVEFQTPIPGRAPFFNTAVVEGDRVRVEATDVYNGGRQVSPAAPAATSPVTGRGSPP